MRWIALAISITVLAITGTFWGLFYYAWYENNALALVLLIFYSVGVFAAGFYILYALGDNFNDWLADRQETQRSQLNNQRMLEAQFKALAAAGLANNRFSNKESQQQAALGPVEFPDVFEMEEM